VKTLFVALVLLLGCTLANAHEAGHWERADKYLTERCIQRNPLAASGRDGVVKFFTEVMKVQPTPVLENMNSKIAAVLAEGDCVTVAYVREVKDLIDRAKTDTTMCVDMWGSKDTGADEHSDPATTQ
jgi:predicted SnoaL-like aldol condensation-catalyzing enzyme